MPAKDNTAVVKELSRFTTDLDKLSTRLTKLSDGMRVKITSRKATGAEAQIATVVDGINDQIGRLFEKYTNRLEVLELPR